MRIMTLEECRGRIPNPPFRLPQHRVQEQRPSPPPIDLGEGGEGSVTNDRVPIGRQARQRSYHEPATSARQRPSHGAAHVGVAVTQQAGEVPGDPSTRNAAQGMSGAGADVTIRRTQGRKQPRNIRERWTGAVGSSRSAVISLRLRAAAGESPVT